MRDRLIKLIEEFSLTCNRPCDELRCRESCRRCGCEQLADHLLTNGVIVPLCKVGDAVYMPWEWKGTSGVALLTVERIVVDFRNRSFVSTDFFSDDEGY